MVKSNLKSRIRNVSEEYIGQISDTFAVKSNLNSRIRNVSEIFEKDLFDRFLTHF